MTANSHRLTILSPEEIDDLYAPPRFTDKERELYFALDATESEIATSRRGAVGVYFVLLLGYFKAKRRFFDAALEIVEGDIQYIVARYFPDVRSRLLQTPSRPTILALQDRVLELHQFHHWKPSLRGEIVERLAHLAMRSTQPRYLLREALQYLERDSIVAPPYTVLQDVVGEAVAGERNRLTGLLKKALTPTARRDLDALLQADGFMYRISLLKQDLNDFSYKALKEEVGRRQSFKPLHIFAQKFLANANISQESSKYYASLVMYYTVYKLQRMDPLVARLYLCFAYHRYRQINDHLVEAFMVRVEAYTRQAKLAGEEAMQQALIEGSENLKAAGEILNLFVDESLPNDASFATVKAKAFTFLDRERIPTVADYMRNVAFDKVGFQWTFYTSLSLAIKMNLRHLFVELDFVGRVKDAPLTEAVNFLQKHLRQGHTPRQIEPRLFPVKMIPKRLRRYLFIIEKGPDRARRLEVDRYEFLVYRLLCDAIAAGNVYVQESNEYRSFEDDLISDERWRNKDAVLRDVGAPILRVPIQVTLDALRAELEEKFERVNARISEKANAHITIRGKADKRRWNLSYAAQTTRRRIPFMRRSLASA